MTFSSKAVEEALASGFTCVRQNLDGDPIAGTSYAHKPTDPPGNCIRGNGEHNVQMLFLSPAGEILHVVAGFVEPADFLEEIAFANEVRRLSARCTKDRAEEIVAYRHEKALEALRKKPATGTFAAFENERREADHEFVRTHPLLPIGEFRAEDLVGRAQTFFGSSTGKTPEKRIGRETLKAPETPKTAPSAAKKPAVAPERSEKVPGEAGGSPRDKSSRSAKAPKIREWI